MKPARNIYVLDTKELSPETIAVAFAKTSRSPESFRDIAAELSETASAEFHEKWVVGYGHSSIAEHAILHIALENISRLATETLEANRLASYTERSTRYQKWDPEHFHVPQELSRTSLEQDYIETNRKLFDVYHQSLPLVRKVVAEQYPVKSGEKDSAYEQRIRSKYVDACRYLLPVSAFANVGVTINARALEYAICKMLSHPLEEVRSIGEEMQAVAQSIVPTLVKYVAPVDYLVNIQTRMPGFTFQDRDSNLNAPVDWCSLYNLDSQLEDKLLAAALYRYNQVAYVDALLSIQQMSSAERDELAKLVYSGIGKYENPLRELEHSYFTFELILDQGAFLELKRHRMMTQSPQQLTADLGYAVPKLISDAGFETPYRESMEIAQKTYDRIAGEVNPDVAAYVVPNAFNRRVLLTFNLRSADHFCMLRSAPNAHFAIRRVALRIADTLRTHLPLLGSYIRSSSEETWQDVEKNHFACV